MCDGDNITVAIPPPEVLAAAVKARSDQSEAIARQIRSRLTESYIEQNQLEPREVSSFLLGCSQKGCTYSGVSLDTYSNQELLDYSRGEVYAKMYQNYIATGWQKCPTHMPQSDAGTVGKTVTDTGSAAAQPGASTAGESRRKKQPLGFTRCGYTCTTENTAEKNRLEKDGQLEVVSRPTNTGQAWTLQCTAERQIFATTRPDGTKIKPRFWTANDKYGKLLTFCGEMHAIDHERQMAKELSNTEPSDADDEV
ncbi:hypothetical protein I317_07104 [Kwoniella heveanensis CBS 569]|nr:hypothetical protein I317_07104 [Kwoniella heveanensis CBS 569]